MKIFSFSSACLHLGVLKICHKESPSSEAMVLLVVPELSSGKETLSLGLLIPPFFSERIFLKSADRSSQQFHKFTLVLDIITPKASFKIN